MACDFSSAPDQSFQAGGFDLPDLVFDKMQPRQIAAHLCQGFGGNGVPSVESYSGARPPLIGFRRFANRENAPMVPKGQ